MIVVNYLRAHPEQIMPILMMLLSIGSSAVYFSQGSVRRGLYWLAATVLTGSVTF
jgi:hypothetical protein